MQPEAFFRALGDPTRLRCLLLLQQEGELCVCELTEALDLSQPKISRHLAHLRDAGIVQVRREGTWVFYRASSELSPWARDVLQQTYTGTQDSERFQADHRRLQAMEGRPARAGSP
ncbi:metalloregulator ArsR/SmtB family transcription factor [Guyparkeria sp. 1SP6A2]|nr:metalloregulator ArsR/SmtB family transcription factor [Guyparkeria sp. 1SP6A2]